MNDRVDASVEITNHEDVEVTEKTFKNSVFSVPRWFVKFIAFAALGIVGCGRGTPTSQESVPAVAPGPAQANVAQAVTDFPRPPKPSKAYRLGVSIPHLANPHYVGQAYGYI